MTRYISEHSTTALIDVLVEPHNHYVLFLKEGYVFTDRLLLVHKLLKLVNGSFISGHSSAEMFRKYSRSVCD